MNLLSSLQLEYICDGNEAAGQGHCSAAVPAAPLAVQPSQAIFQRLFSKFPPPIWAVDFLGGHSEVRKNLPHFQ